MTWIWIWLAILGVALALIIYKLTTCNCLDPIRMPSWYKCSCGRCNGNSNEHFGIVEEYYS